MSGYALPDDLAPAVALGGEMGRRFAEYDWASHPLGGPDQWPAEIRSAVAVVLTSRFPIVLWLGATDLFVVYNDAYIPILGEKHPTALGQAGSQVWWDIWEPISPMLSSVVATGTATWSRDLMLPMMTAGKRRERYFTFTYSTLIDDRGEIYGIFCPSFETTERVLSERRLHVLNAVAAAVMETQTIDAAVHAAVGVCTEQPADTPFIAVYVGAAGSTDLTLRGATPSLRALLPSTLTELIDWDATARSRAELQTIDDLTAVLPGIDAVLGAGCPEQALVLPLGEADTTGALVLGVNPLCALDDQYAGFCQLLADQLSSALAAAVSYAQQRARADALAELDRAKTAFLTNVSHEFRTPLTLLMGPLDDALAEEGVDDVLAHRLGAARRNAGRLLRLVDSLLDFSRIEAGRAAPKLRCIDVGGLTAHIASSFTELCQRAGLELTLDCQSVLADVDPAMWETIMLNLLSNAVKYTLRGTISVHVSADPANCLVRVRDTGVGIAEQDLDRLFERFYRADNARGRSVEGTGIGLSLVRGLVELQHGTVEITSELDVGTVVSIRLPKSRDGVPVDHSVANLLDNPYLVEANQWVSPPLGRSQPPATRSRQLVLVADDNADMRAHLELVLSRHWDTVLVGDGETALNAARDLRPDAIVTDVMMPRLDGFDFVTAIRADPELAATPIVMLSARAGTEAVSEGYAGGADDYLPKPFRSQELVDRLSARLSAAERERAGQQLREAEFRLAADLDGKLQGSDSLEAILAALLGICDANAASIGMLDDDGVTVRFEYGGDLPTELRDRYYVATMGAPLAAVDVISKGEPMIAGDTFALPPRYHHSVRDAAENVRAFVMHPLRGRRGQVIGVMALLWGMPRRFETAELDRFARAADVTEVALDRIRSTAREHRIAVDFQEHLLDLDRRSTAAVVAAVYQPAGEAMRVGGDWYLVAPLDRSGRLGVSVGDVVGHGLPAAIVMSKLRAGVAATALTEADPDAVVHALDTYAATVPGARGATVTYGLLEVEAGTADFSYICAGHPYPLLVPADGPPVFLRTGRRRPVASGAGGPNPASPEPTTARVGLPVGGLLVLYTDGLIERAGETLGQGFARLQAAAVGCADLPVESVCDELLHRMRPSGGFRDDVVVLALRPSHAGPRSFVEVMPAVIASIPTNRQRLHGWLDALGVQPDRQQDILLATGEAVTNAIEHGSHCDAGKTVSVEAFLAVDAVTVTVSDVGRWVGDSSASLRSRRRGRGLTIISRLADQVDTIRSPDGTRVTLQFDKALR
ncbi:SpoIIE family protein phosphatase [Mycobacterium sp. 1423905.2]|uniref:SpoIIE family protein phosphatase n=1 Tax=Mycobacterium sp. 1423905.2 TaxID=1856859 RepID=UPI0008003F22|nr:SpoIIE family protein phosphatase [Mycobacterium sp. 1423905.2]OBJ60379.1 histidine kinase [Mycobacterium sp. 1423905.2]